MSEDKTTETTETTEAVAESAEKAGSTLLLVTIQNRMDRIFTLNLPFKGVDVAKRPTGKGIKIMPGGFAKDIEMSLLEEAMRGNPALDALFQEEKLKVVGSKVEEIDPEELIQESTTLEMPADLVDKSDATTDDGKVKHDKKTETIEVPVPAEPEPEKASSSAAKPKSKAPAGGRKKS